MQLIKDRDRDLKQFNPSRKLSVFADIQGVIEPYVSQYLQFKTKYGDQGLAEAVERVVDRVLSVAKESKVIESTQGVTDAKALQCISKIYFPLTNATSTLKDPNNRGTHYSLLVADLQNSIIYYLDSIDYNKVNKKQSKYIEGGIQILKGLYDHFGVTDTPPLRDWPVKTGSDCNVDPQTNQVDCGCFCVTYIDYLNDDIPLCHIKAADMSLYRKRYAVSLINKHLPYSLDCVE